ncbi:MAG TPA: pyocin knob domain-containing protein [Parapedobacter sp.]|uniref:beta strand repeat-containing protein n=1 Tax=Parapedobacter sp. TaxID=1958893 RepID=UPI002B80F060|nr:pyocin knob domain-containing protein [Parapedobacter sp.]HWK58744.1 pyocin knob domain-containing protein [Parapedobacter sp.]
MRRLLTLFFVVCALTSAAQTQPNLPSGALPYGNQLFKDLQGNIWTGRGPYINLGSWHNVDSLLALKADAAALADFYTQSQINAFLALKADASALDDFYTKAAADVLLAGKVDKTATITNSGGLDVGGSLASGSVSIGLNDTYLNNRFLRKDVDDETDNTLTVADLIAEAAEVTELQLPSLATMASATDFLVVDGSGNVGKKQLDEVSIDIANAGGTTQFPIGNNEKIRFAATGDASVSFNPATNTITYNSVPGSGTGGVVTSVFGRDGGVTAEVGDYSTTQVTEGTNQYFTQPRVRATPITGYAATNSVMVSTDNIVQALGKAQGQINARALASRTLTVSGTAGRIVASGGAQDITQNREWTLDLAPSGITPGAYTKPTFDAYGRATGGASLAAGDIPTLPISKVTGLQSALDGKESSSNKATSFGTLNNTLFPTTQAVATYVGSQIPSAQTLYLGSSSGQISISNGNSVSLSSLGRATVIDDIVEGWPATVGAGLWPFSNTTGSTGYPLEVGTGILFNRLGTADFRQSWMLWKSGTLSDHTLRVNFGTGINTWSGWITLADRDWVSSQIPTIPTDYVNTTGNQSAIAGVKQWVSNHRWQPTSDLSIVTGGVVDIGFSNGNGAFIRGGQRTSATQSFLIRGYQNNGVQLELNEGGVNVPESGTAGYLIGGSTIVAAASGSTVLSSPSNNGVVYIYPNGRTNAVNRSIFSSTNTTIGTLTGPGIQLVTADAGGVLGRTAMPSIGNGTLSLNTGTGLTGTASFTANQTGNTSFTVATASGYLIPTTGDIGTWNTAYSRSLTDVSFNAANGNLVLLRQTGGNWTTSLDGRYYIDGEQGIPARGSLYQATATTGGNQPNLDFNDFVSPGFYKNLTGQGWANKPTTGTYWHLQNLQYIGDNTTQVVWPYRANTEDIWLRSRSTGTWSDWYMVFTTRNFNPANYQTTITGAASTIASSDLTAGRALGSNASGKVVVSATTTTELAYLSGATSNIQTQLNSKEAAFSKNTAFNKNFGTAAGTVAQGNDSRIVNAVPNTRQINGKALSANVTLTAADVSAVPISGNATITGTKTFTSPVKGVNATANDEFVTMAQMNTAVQDNIIRVDSLAMAITDSSLPANSLLSQNYAVSGVITSDVVVVNHDGPTQLIASAKVLTSGTITITIHNPYTTNVTGVPNVKFSVRVIK